MSATDIIEEIRKLPAAEQEQVLAFLQRARGQVPLEERDVRYVSDAEFEKSASKVLREHAELFRRLAQ